MAKGLAKKKAGVHSLKQPIHNYEETMLQGMIIGLAKWSWKNESTYIRLFVPRI